MFSAIRASEKLTSLCGSDLKTAALQDTWTAVRDFYTSCDATMSRSVEACPNFSAQPFVTREGGKLLSYLKESEWGLGCSGFCEWYAKPLFNTGLQEASESQSSGLQDNGEAPDVQELHIGKRCSSEIGKKVGSVGRTVGAPVFGMGIALISVGLVLAGYDNL